MTGTKRLRRVSALSCAAAAVVSGLVTIIPPTVAAANPAPVTERASSSVTADPLPAPQIDGVIWTQAVVGNVDYAGGSYTKARPAGAAPGDPTEVARSNLLAFDVTTGALNSAFAPILNAEVKVVTASPDGTRIYVGGSFTTVNGLTRNRIAAFNTSDGTLVTSWAPSLDAAVNAIAVTNNAVYVGGYFANSGSTARARLAAFDPTSGALLGWAPSARGGDVNALQVSPDGSRVVVGGSFTTMNGSASAYGLASINATDASLFPWAANSIIQDGGPNAAIESLTTDGTAIIGTGYKYGVGGNFEGTFSADPSTGNLNWMEDCHGDTYSNFPLNGNVYVVGHAHYCANVGGFPQTTPVSTFHRTLEFTNQATGTLLPNGFGDYTSFAGQPSPTLRNWFPDLSIGSYTGQNQAAWTVTGNSNYLVEGGEFLSVNGKAQQGLVRFAAPPTVTPKVGPTLSGGAFVPNLQVRSTTSVRVAWQANYDRDDQILTYKLVRNGNTSSPLYTTTVTSQIWSRPGISYLDSGLTAGSTYTYRLYATDPDGNTAAGNSVTITLPKSDPGPYFQDVLRDGATNYWRLDDASCSTAAADFTGNDYLSYGSTVTCGAAGALGGSNTADPASTFSGTSPTGQGETTDLLQAPTTFSVEAWFNTTSTKGGKIVGFGSGTLGNSSGSYDRHIYMDNSGHLVFGVTNNGVFYVATTANTYNDGTNHYVVGTLSDSGVTLYVDGIRVARNPNTTTAKVYAGYWHVGGDDLNNWPSKPTSYFFNGTIDEVAIYSTALNPTQIETHYTDSGRTLSIPTPPTDTYGQAVYNDGPDQYWRLDDTAGPTAADVTPNVSKGTYSGGETFRVPSTVTGSNGTGVTFNGTSGTIGSVAQIANPTVYSEEAWIKTTTTKGGQIIGFGNAQSGASTSYDRDVYMQNDGTLVFGTNSSSYTTATTTTAYNDGKWHHIVATQGVHGMILYVDGLSAATNSTKTAQSYTGYWRVGGNTDRGGTSAYFAGTIDEVSIYNYELAAAQVLAHYKASPASVNRAPKSTAKGSCSGLTCSFDAGASKDPDGTIVLYSWKFGDGSTGTGATVSHAYSSAGTYTATVTVTDDQGATNSASVTVKTTAGSTNQPPTASFTDTCTYLACSFDASASRDSDGAIRSYAWAFGDGTTGSGVTVTHAYSATGTYTAKLTVTDNQGATASSSQSMTVRANRPPTASFTYSCTHLNCKFDGSGSTDPDGTVHGYSWTFGDGASETVPTPSHSFAKAGTYTVTLTVTDDGNATNSTSKSITVSANTPPTAVITSTCTYLICSFSGSRSSDPDGSVATYAWTFGDGSTSTAQSPSHTYAKAGTYTVALTVTDNQGAKGSTSTSVTVVANKPPAAAFTYSCSGLSCSFDGSPSTDSDGSIVSYAWNFGDGSTSTSMSPSHMYTSLGAKTITLTVTDNGGLTNTASKQITITLL